SQPPLEPVDLRRRRTDESTVYSLETLQDWTSGCSARIGWGGQPELRVEFGIPRLEHADQRALRERRTDRLHLGKLLASSEDVKKCRCLPRHPSVRDRLEKDDRP